MTVFFLAIDENDSDSPAVSQALRITHIHNGLSMLKCSESDGCENNILLLKKEQDWKIKCKLSGVGRVRLLYFGEGLLQHAMWKDK